MHDLIQIPVNIFKGNEGLEKIRYIKKGILWAISKRIGISFTAKLWNGSKVKVSPNNSYSPIFYYKYPEGKDMEFLRLNADAGTTFVDVGANVGIFTALMADKFRTIVMFEPSEESFRAI